ncbi:helix-turn-helix transcriptional regulator [Kribbella sp. NPDC051770]|uniref:helix-turn-helix transcriptional regulator n=1 Tax=Kribbella sp. NPDC051770 TaxID=3155413 RepID=UPI0034494B34
MGARRELARLLRSGPFEAALDVAIAASGLSLRELSERLEVAGVSVSPTALSYWRRGRSRPERGASLVALGKLEEILGVPECGLVALLGGRRPRGRWLGHPPGTLDRWKLWPSTEALLTELDAPPDGRLAYLSTNDVLVVDEDKEIRRQRVRLVAEAAVEDVDRCVVYHELEDPEDLVPELVGVAFGRRGRVRCDLTTRQFVAEFLFDRPLRVGEHTVVDYELRLPVSQPLDHFYRHFTRPGGLYTLQLRFLGRQPAWIRRYERTGADGPDRLVGDLWLGGSGTTSLVVPQVRSGTVGVRWLW